MATDHEKLIQEIEVKLSKRSVRTVERLYKRLDKMEEKIKTLSSKKIAPKVDQAALKKAQRDLNKLKVENTVSRARRTMERETRSMSPGERGSAQGVFTRQVNAMQASIAAGLPIEKALQVFAQKRASSMEKIRDRAIEATNLSKKDLKIARERSKLAEAMSQQGMKAGNTYKFRSEFKRINSEFKKGTIDLDQYNKQIDRLHRQIAKGTGLRRLANQLRDVRHAVVGLSAAYAAFNFGAQAFRIGSQFEGLHATMLMASGDMKTARKDMSFVTREANRLGQELAFATDGYVKLAVASRGKLDDSQVKELFTGFSEFATAMGTDPQRYEKGVMAIGQMLSKGQIYREELVGQLAEQMPGALQVFSRALGVTDAELLKMSERGELLAKDVFPLVAAEFRKTANESGALAQQLKNPSRAVITMRNKFKEMVHEFYRSGFGRAIANLAVAVSGVIEGFKVLAPLLGGVFLGALTPIALALAVVSDAIMVVVVSLRHLGYLIDDIFGEEVGDKVRGWSKWILIAAGAVGGLTFGLRMLLKVMRAISGIASRFLPTSLVDKVKGIGKAAGRSAGKGAMSSGTGRLIPGVGAAVGAVAGGSRLYKDLWGDYASIRGGGYTLTDKGVVPTSSVMSKSAAISKSVGMGASAMPPVNLIIKTEETDYFKNHVEVVNGVNNVKNNISE